MSFLKKYYPHILLAVITIFGLGIRVYSLHLNIPELYADETGGGYQNLYTILNSENYLSRLRFVTFSFTWFLGLTPLGVRSSSAIYGTLLILSVYFFTKKINGSTTALLSSLLIATIPATFVLSRFGAPHVLIITVLTCIHAGLFLQAKKISSYALSFLSIALAFFYYPSFVIFTPIILFLTFFYILQLSSTKQKQFLIGSGVLFTLIFTLIYIFKLGGLSPSSRGLDLAIWSDVNVTAAHNQYRGIAGESLASKFVYNKPLSIGRNFVLNYASFFSPDWLFFKGDPVLRHSTSMVGSLFPILAPFLIFGAFRFFSSSKIHKKAKTLFLVWILISPIPASLTTDGAGYLLRVITIMPFLVLLSAFGITSFYSLIKNKYLKLAYTTFIVFSIIFSTYTFLYGYFKVYPTLASQSFEYGFKDLSDFQVGNNNSSMLIIWQGDYPKNHFYFWQNVPFDKSLDNLYFAWPANEKELNNFLGKTKIDYLVYPNDYLVRNPEYLPVADPVKIIKYPDSKTAFTIYKIN